MSTRILLINVEEKRGELLFLAKVLGVEFDSVFTFLLVNFSWLVLVKIKEPASCAFLSFLAQGWRNICAQQLDGTQKLRLRQFCHIHLKRDSRDAAQRFTVAEDFFRHFFRVAYQQCAVLTPYGFEVGTGETAGQPRSLPMRVKLLA
jgi:hypothetical protein